MFVLDKSSGGGRCFLFHFCTKWNNSYNVSEWL